MEVRRTVNREVRRVIFISTASAVAALLIFTLLGKLTFTVAGGIVSGLVSGMVNFCQLAGTVMRIGTAEKSDPAAAKRIMAKSYMLRMAFMATFAIAAIIFLKVNPLAHGMMLVLPCFAVRIRRR